MFLLFTSFVASLDGFLIGMGLRLANISLTKKNILTIFIGNLLIYSFFLILYSFFHLSFMTKLFSTILYLLFAWKTFREKEKENSYQETLNFKECLLLTLTHSLDGTIVSLRFVYFYSLWKIIFIFSFSSLFLLLLGYFSARIFKNFKKGNYLATGLFLILAILNQFF